MPVNKPRAVIAIAAVVLALGAAMAWSWSRPAPPKSALGLFTSLPLYWNESGSVGEALDPERPPHWARTALEKQYRLAPIDVLDNGALAPYNRLLMAQPRPLAPAENVALDRWVREGGRLLLFADPLLTEESRFPFGDKRRPQGTALLSPILGRWGLQLTFDPDQSDGERVAKFGAIALPERFAGRLVAIPHDAPARCAIAAQGLIADCIVEAGRVLIVADAALLEAHREPSAGVPSLIALGTHAFERDRHGK